MASSTELFSSAQSEGRSFLYEFEVYSLLASGAVVECLDAFAILGINRRINNIMEFGD